MLPKTLSHCPPLLVAVARAFREVAAYAARHAVVVGVSACVVFAVQVIPGAPLVGIVLGPSHRRVAIVALSGSNDFKEPLVRKCEVVNLLLPVQAVQDSISDGVMERAIWLNSAPDPIASLASIPPVQLRYGRSPLMAARKTPAEPALILISVWPLPYAQPFQYEPLPDGLSGDVHEWASWTQPDCAFAALARGPISEMCADDGLLMPALTAARICINAIDLRLLRRPNHCPFPEYGSFGYLPLNAHHAHYWLSFFQRARAAFRAISVLCSCVIVLSLALPPFRPSCMAAGFFRFAIQ